MRRRWLARTDRQTDVHRECKGDTRLSSRRIIRLIVTDRLAEHQDMAAAAAAVRSLMPASCGGMPVTDVLSTDSKNPSTNAIDLIYYDYERPTDETSSNPRLTRLEWRPIFIGLRVPLRQRMCRCVTEDVTLQLSTGV